MTERNIWLTVALFCAVACATSKPPATPPPAEAPECSTEQLAKIEAA